MANRRTQSGWWRNGRAICLLALAALTLQGCNFYLHAIPARRLPPGLRAPQRSGSEPINLLSMRRDPEEAERIRLGDVLAIDIVDPAQREEIQREVPFYIPRAGERLRPSTGQPYTVRHDGTINLPVTNKPVYVAELTTVQAEDALRDALTDQYNSNSLKISVTILHRRIHKVLVIREDAASRVRQTSARDEQSAEVLGISTRGTAEIVELEEGQNDVLHALSLTGGTPALDAKNEVVILRGKFAEADEWNQLLDRYTEQRDPCGEKTPLPEDPTVVKIPLRVSPNTPYPDISQDDVILTEGDVVLVQRRPLEVFYTGGLLNGASFPLRRDEDVDILEALALAGGNSRGIDLGFGGLGGGTGGLIPPTWAIVVRKVEGRQPISIKVDLKKALRFPQERIRVQPDDIILLAYKPHEILANIMLRNVTGTVQVNDIFE